MAARKPGRPLSQKTILVREVERAMAAKAAPQDEMAKRVKMQYDAAGRGRRMGGWNPPSSGPNRAIEGLQTIRNRARDSSRNDWSGESSIQKWTTNLIGVGITPRFKRITNRNRKQEISDLWADFVAQADADGVLDLYGMQTLVVRSWLDGGECFARRRPRFLDEGFVVPMQVQLLEAEMVPMLDADTYEGLPQSNVIRSGIEFNRRGRRVAYWVYKQHPGDTLTFNFGADELVRVLAADMLHVFEPKRPGQIRGVSMLAPILARLRNVEDYDDATLERQKLANLFVGFLTKDLPPIPGDIDVDPLTGLPLDDGALIDTPLAGLQPGLFQELDAGQKVDWSNPPEAGTTYSDYMRTQHMGTASAAGLPYEVFSGDIVNVSDRTLRVIINEFRRFAEQRQWQIIIPQFCQGVVNWFTQACVLADLVGIDEYEDVRRVEHSPHGFAHIHPVQDPTGKKLEVDAGFISRSAVIGAKGDDPDAVDQERADDQKRADRLGLSLVPAATVSQQKAAQPAAEPTPPPPPP